MSLEPAPIRQHPMGRALVPRARRPGGRLVGAIIALAVAGWVVAGLLRAPALARDYLERLERPKQLSGVTMTLGPAIPPFWSVHIVAKVTEATGTSYSTAQILWVEPISGLVLSLGAG